MFKLTRLVSLLFLILVLTGCMTRQFDVGGIELRNIKQPSKNLISGGQPTEESLRALHEKGLKNIINLRTEGESAGFDEKNVAESLGASYFALPISGRTGITFENAQKFKEILANAKGPTLAHCASGNRVGAMVALNAYLKEGDVEKAIAAGKAAGLTRLEGKVRKVIKERALD